MYPNGRCSIGSYFTTEKAAWKAELASYKAGLKQQIKQRHELTEIIKQTRQTIKELKGKVGIKPRLTNAELSAPGLLSWAINGYHFKKDRKSILNVMKSWNGPTDDEWHRLLSKEIPYTVNDANEVEFTV